MLSNPWLLLTAALAAGISYALTPLVAAFAVRFDIVDRPGPRKVHDRPIPKLGGVAIATAGAIGLGVLFALEPGPPRGVSRGVVMGLGLGILPVLIVSAIDDVRGLSPAPRFLGQVLGAAIAVGCGISLGSTIHLFGTEIPIGSLAVPLSLLWIVGVTNAFNLIDGLDGLSAGSALISAGSLVAVFVLANQPATALAALVVVGALVGFLPYNIYPARIFMGDIGATAVGFCLACLTLKGGSTLTAGFATLLPVVVLAVPLADTLLSICRRLLGRFGSRSDSGVFNADRNHIHHRLLAMGFDHRRAVLLLYGVGVACAAFALLSILMTTRVSGLFLLGLFLAGTIGVTRLGYEEFAVIRNGLVLKVYDAPVLQRSLFAVFADLVLVCAAVYAAVALKFDDPLLAFHRQVAFGMMAVLGPIAVATNWSLGVYRGMWRLASVADLSRLSLAVAVSAFVGYLVYGVVFSERASLTLFVIYAAVKLFVAQGSRMSYQVVLTSRQRARRGGVPTVIYGAGRHGNTVLRQLLANERFGMRAVAFVDDGPNRAGRTISGVPITGGIDSLHETLLRLSARKLIVSTQKILPANLEKARRICGALTVDVMSMSINVEPLDPVAFYERHEDNLPATEA